MEYIRLLTANLLPTHTSIVDRSPARHNAGSKFILATGTEELAISIIHKAGLNWFSSTHGLAGWFNCRFCLFLVAKKIPRSTSKSTWASSIKECCCRTQITRAKNVIQHHRVMKVIRLFTTFTRYYREAKRVVN